MSQLVSEVTVDTFADEVKNEKQLPVLVDFWASWCGPCLMIAPAVEKIAEDLSGRLKVCTLNVDENPQVASEFGVMSIPTLILFKDGEEKERIVGAIGEHDIKEKIQKHVS